MKRSKLFLGVTTCLLAVAGIAATKAYRAPLKISYYFTKPNGLNCVQFPIQKHCTVNGPNGLCVTNLPKPGGGVSSYQLYSVFVSSSQCDKVLRINNN